MTELHINMDKPIGKNIMNFIQYVLLALGSGCPVFSIETKYLLPFTKIFTQYQNLEFLVSVSYHGSFA